MWEKCIMAVSAAVVSVGASATALLSSASGDGASGASVLVKNPSGATSTVYIGGSDVDTTDGFPLAAGESVSLDVGDDETVYGVVPALTQNVNVIRTGV